MSTFYPHRGENNFFLWPNEHLDSCRERHSIAFTFGNYLMSPINTQPLSLAALPCKVAEHTKCAKRNFLLIFIFLYLTTAPTVPVRLPHQECNSHLTAPWVQKAAASTTQQMCCSALNVAPVFCLHVIVPSSLSFFFFLYNQCPVITWVVDFLVCLDNK